MRAGSVDTMKRVRTMLAHRYPYPHEHSRHAMVAMLISSVLFISSDNLHTLLHKLEDNVKWWSIYACLFGFFYFFSSPFLGRTIRPSYTNFSRWYIAWLFLAAVYHLPSFQSMGVDIRMNLSLFLTVVLASVATLIFFHVLFVGLWHLGLFARLHGERPEILTILQNSVVMSVACCVFYSHCGNRASDSSGSEAFEWSGFRNLKHQVCSSWLGPVGSARDYPTFSHLALYGELVLSDTIKVASDDISPVYSLWATFIGLYMANYVIERSSGWAVTHLQPLRGEETNVVEKPVPNFLPMVPWYSGTSADLIKTAFDLLVSVTLFLGRFDMRTMQAAMSSAQQQQGGRGDGFTYKHLSGRKELWFDFMADTGDGGDSTYTVARLLAQPSITALSDDGVAVDLPRASLLLIGGDLAYPSPTPTSYEQRLFQPFEYAMQPPAGYRPSNIAVKKTDEAGLRAYDGPQCFAIPGNHDWFDGLDTFMKYICHKSWLGGWILPQEKSYFALKLPHGWWVFGLDQALHSDIDIFQLKYFSTIADEQIQEGDNVIIMTHEPNWLLDWFWGGTTGTNTTYLIEQHLGKKCKVRVAGDLHHYMRHSTNQPSTSEAGCSPRNFSYCEHLIVNGGGGAFLHPTHVFADFSERCGTPYERKGCYPSISDSRKIGLRNILKFRKMNWQFDVVGGISYFILVFSLFPRCRVGQVINERAWQGQFFEFVGAVGGAALEMVQHSYVSAVGAAFIWAIAVLFVPRGRRSGMRAKLVLGTIHFLAHITCALVLMVLLELGIETCIRHGLLGITGYHSLYDYYQERENEHFPDPTGLRSRMEEWTFGFYPACIKYLMAAFDVPEVMAVTRNTICTKGIEALPRGFTVVYYMSVFLYFWVFSTPVVSLVFGCYLYISINWLHLHLDEAFSSLRIANYKSFLRCHITSSGDLEIFAIAVDKVPKGWSLDQDWEEEKARAPHLPSHKREHPSQWVPEAAYRDKLYNARVIDHFWVTRDSKDDTSPSSMSSSSNSTGSGTTSSFDERSLTGLLRRTNSGTLLDRQLGGRTTSRFFGSMSHEEYQSQSLS